MENEDLKKIKKIYGEEFMKMCRRNFPTLLETPGLLFKLITDHVEPTKNFMKFLSLDPDPIEVEDAFKNFIYSFVDVEQDTPEAIEKTAKELMDEAGYVLFPECQTEEQIQKFRGFYGPPPERLCTFNGGRLNHCRVWFAVKKNAVSLDRKKFTNPKREDEYGTSVISIQFTRRTPSTLSIKNRYNHAVNNPDNTFLNNPQSKQ